MFGSINKTFGRCGKIFGCRNKKKFVVPNFVAVTITFFSVEHHRIEVLNSNRLQKYFTKENIFTHCIAHKTLKLKNLTFN